MRTRIIDKETGNIVWFGVKNVKLISKGFTCGNDKICGSNYDYITLNNEQVSMMPITVYNDIVYYYKSIFANENHNSYSSGTQAVANSIRQRLSVLKNELWYDFTNGLPITDKVKNKSIIDAYIIKTILQHPDVIDIEGFQSKQLGHIYSCYIIINTIYGSIEIGI